MIGNTEIIEMETGSRLWVSQKVTPNISFLSRFDLVLKLLINSKTISLYDLRELSLFCSTFQKFYNLF